MKNTKACEPLHRAPVGELNISKVNCCIGRGLASIKAKNNEEQRFIYYSIKANQLAFLSRAYGAVYDAISGPDLRKTKLLLPTKTAVRIKIAKILSAYDDLIENNLKRIKLLEEMAQKTYEEWFVRMKFPGHETAKFDKETGLPEGWERVKLGEVLELNYGKALKADARNGGEYPVFGSAGIVGWHNKYICEKKGIIVGRKGNVGSVFWSELDFYPIDTSYYVSSVIPLQFIYYLIKSISFINNDAAVPGLNRNAAYFMKCILPQKDLIYNFSKRTDLIFTQIQNLKHQNQRLKEARDILLPRLMTGMIDVEKMSESGFTGLQDEQD